MLNTAVGVLFTTLCLLVMIYLNYIWTWTRERTQRRLFFSTLALAMAGTLLAFIYLLLAGSRWPGSTRIILAVLFVEQFLQVKLFNRGLTLLAHVLKLSPRHIRQIKRGEYALSGLYALMLIVNIFHPFLYGLSVFHFFSRGPWYLLRTVFLLVGAVVFSVYVVRDRRQKMGALARYVSILMLLLAVNIISFFTSHILIWLCVGLMLLSAYLAYLRHESESDVLTGASNRRALDRLLHWLLSGRRQGQYAIMMIDLNDFKRLNDRYGHLEGDKTLRAFVQAIRRAGTPQDMVLRVGGDEFLLVRRGKIDIETLAADIHNSLVSICLSQKDVYSVDFAYADVLLRPGDDVTASELLSQVDKRLYKNKALCAQWL